MTRMTRPGFNADLHYICKCIYMKVVYKHNSTSHDVLFRLITAEANNVIDVYSACNLYNSTCITGTAQIVCTCM